MTETVLRVEGLHKKFCRSLKRSMFYGTIDIMRDMLSIPYKTNKLRQSEFWALSDVNLEVKRGEKIGFLGVNGSGKTTLLRMINGIFPPDAGKISVTGNIGALIAVGVGFHPHMTGRENIYLNGTILGMTKTEIKQKLDSIIDFAEIEDAIDAPVSTYSSGMTVRLGFSIAIHKNPDIMLVDEVLAVGDLAFQLKCQRKLSEYRQAGGTFIIVSHSMQLIRNTCDRVIWLEKGRIVDIGEVYELCDRYETATLSKAQGITTSSKTETQDQGTVLNYDPQVRITRVEFLDGNDKPSNTFRSGERLRIRINYKADRHVERPIFSLCAANLEGQTLFECYSIEAPAQIPPLSGEGAIDFTIDHLNIQPNIYSVSVTLSENETLYKLEWHEKAYNFTVIPGKYHINQGLMYPYPSWTIL